MTSTELAPFDVVETPPIRDAALDAVLSVLANGY